MIKKIYFKDMIKNNGKKKNKSRTVDHSQYGDT